jgi:hypothetical protein
VLARDHPVSDGGLVVVRPDWFEPLASPAANADSERERERLGKGRARVGVGLHRKDEVLGPFGVSGVMPQKNAPSVETER